MKLSQTDLGPFGFERAVGDVDEAFDRYRTSVAEDLLDFPEEYQSVLHVFTGGDNWRKRENPAYKANRKDPKPDGYRDLLSRVKAAFPCTEANGMEGDDLMGVLATAPGYVSVCVVSIDKDMLGVPCASWNPDKKGPVRRPTLEEADRFFWTQVLTGDPVDGYKGAFRVGPKKAERILCDVDCSDYRSVWKLIVDTYEACGQTEEEARMNARMARICRYGEWNPNERTLEWQPDDSPLNSRT